MDHYIITIARSYGSGGKIIALELAKRLGIPCYENEILDMASDKSGISKQLFYNADEQLRGKRISMLLKRYPSMDVLAPSDRAFLSDKNLFSYQAMIIRNIALVESCIIVGKCADFVLGDLKNVFRFFIDAPHDSCVSAIAAELSIPQEEASRLVMKTNRYRQNYYQFYTGGRAWKDPANYDLIINSARVGRRNTADIIQAYVEQRVAK